MAIPQIVAESQISIFKFYKNGVIHEAILVNNQILRLAGVFEIDDKQTALKFAYKLCREYPTLVTPSPFIYRVWVDVRCQEKFAVGMPLPALSDDVVSQLEGAGSPETPVET